MNNHIHLNSHVLPYGPHPTSLNVIKMPQVHQMDQL